jgi:UDP-2-acetamido-3-amino-2,3-dideoxy-glucuronate N-acetyltransferase
MAIENSAKIASNTEIHASVQIWHNSQVREYVDIGEGSVIGSNCYIGPGVKIGKNVRIQNNVNIYEPCLIRDFVFIGPGVVTTNDKYPRAFNVKGERISEKDWEKEQIEINSYASIGANATLIGPISIGEYSLIGAGSVVSRSVPSHSLTHGNPAKHKHWIGNTGQRLQLFLGGDLLIDSKTGMKFIEVDGMLKDFDE